MALQVMPEQAFCLGAHVGGDAAVRRGGEDDVVAKLAEMVRVLRRMRPRWEARMRRCACRCLFQ
jgi:hypothetical protein